MSVYNLDYSSEARRNRNRTDEIEYLRTENAYLKQMIANMTSPLFDPAIAMDEHANFEPALRRVLCVLHKHFGRVVDHNYLMAALYSEDDGEYAASENIMAQRMSLCRRLMTKHTIQNVRGVGYKLVKKETIVS